ncbi:MAG: hypothetical protein ACXVAY_06630 [Mucilaginibacter sp.]
MKLQWFTRKGIIYWPVSIAGWLVFAIALSYTIYTFIDIDSRSHSVSDTMINFVFSALIIGLIYTVVGYFTERKEANRVE